MLENFLKDNFHGFINRILNHEHHLYIEFTQERAEEMMKKLFFREKFQTKSEYRLKVFSFVNGIQNENFENENWNVFNSKDNLSKKKEDGLVSKEEKELEMND